MLLTIAAFLLVLGVLIFVHELGHFLAAKAVGIGVPRFSIGLGPTTPFSFRREETEYVISWIPFGGYVKMASKEEQDAVEALEGGSLREEFPPEKLFETKPLAARILVISAGVIMNVVFAWVVYTGLAAVVGREEDPTTTIARVDATILPEAAAALAQVPFGTEILRVNGETVASWSAIMTGVTDPTSDELRFDFGGDVDPIILAIPGTEVDTRVAIAQAMIRLWEPRIGMVVPGRPAEAAGIEQGDRIVSAGGEEIRSWDELVRAVEASVGEDLALTIRRSGAELELSVMPVEETVEDPLTDGLRKVGRIGISPLLEPLRVRFGPVDAAAEGARRTWNDATFVLFVLKSMVLGRISPREIGGPILIGQVSGQFARAGGVALLTFMAMLSVNLAILNLLPIPVLDGGHLIFLLLEGVRGKPLSLDVRHRLTQVGLFVLLGIMALVLTNDLLRVIGW
ncbi:MAG: RIP metalloprotease RseP [bacterium]|nr:RIP metalloprotease RseP [bacterium]